MTTGLLIERLRGRADWKFVGVLLCRVVRAGGRVRHQPAGGGRERNPIPARRQEL
jgi:hypothetical protein